MTAPAERPLPAQLLQRPGFRARLRLLSRLQELRPVRPRAAGQGAEDREARSHGIGRLLTDVRIAVGDPVQRNYFTT